MSEGLDDFTALQGRVTAALDRLGQAIEAQATQAGSGEDTAELRQALDDEKIANEQLEERLKAARATRNTLENEIARLREENGQAMSRLDTELQSLRRGNKQLRDNNAALRDANAAGVGEPHLINKSMMAELESLRAERSADAAETGAILSALDSVLQSAVAEQAGANGQVQQGDA